MKKIILLAILIPFYLSAFSAHPIKPHVASTVEQKVDSVLKLMTLDEKIGQLNLPGASDFVTGQAQNSDIGNKVKKGLVGGLFNIKSVAKIKAMQKVAVEQSRLHIPLIFGMDVIHGYETVFPIPLAMSCTWDMAMIEQMARISATEASADGVCWTFSPMVDIARDPRWGRIAEGSGEDPYLGSQIAKAMVTGYQGDFSKSSNIMACVKHYALYGAAEAGRDYNTVDMSAMRMYDDYFPPYKAAVDAGCGSVMVSFNEINGMPATANKWLVTDVLRKQWGFNGFVVTDFTGISELSAHGLGDLQTVSALALKAGVDMDMVSEGFLNTLKKSLQEGKITAKDIDDACRRILKAKFRLGLFDNPYKYCNENRAATEIYTNDHLNFARKMAAESFVLLKNEHNLLPLKKSGTIALIGPLADNRENMPGTWSVAADFSKPSSLLEAVKAAAGGKATVIYAKGANIYADAEMEQRVSVFGKTTNRDNRPAKDILDEAVKVAVQADVIVAAVGESSEMSGECASRSDISIPDAQKDLLKALVATGKPVVLVLFTGRPLTLSWENENIPSILNVWFGGSMAAQAVSDVLFGDVNPSGKLTATFPRSVGQIPIYYAHKSTGRPAPDENKFEKFRSVYLDIPNTPLYPFGYGLSYTQFSYSDISLDKNILRPNGSITATVTVSNTGSRDGEEIVQLYVRDLVGSITRPVKELKGFEKIFLKTGESKTVHFSVSPDMLAFHRADMSYGWEPGDFKLFIGGNSRDVKETSFTLTK
jgi:beta-glucosidase